MTGYSRRMPLPLLALLVVAGISAVVLFVHLVGWSKPARFDGEADARTVLQAEYPDSQIETITLSDNKRIALAQRRDQPPALVHAFGDRFVGRDLSPDLINQVVEVGRALHFKFNDFTDPMITVAIADASARQNWLSTFATVNADKPEPKAAT